MFDVLPRYLLKKCSTGRRSFISTVMRYLAKINFERFCSQKYKPLVDCSTFLADDIKNFGVR